MMPPFLFNSLLVGAGGFAGSVLRYGLSLGLQRLAFVYPAGTLAANLLGCLVIGALSGAAAAAVPLSPRAWLILATGFCGGFTTMSSFMFETASFIRNAEWLRAAVYFTATLVGSFLFFYAGLLLSGWFFRVRGFCP